MMQSMSSAGTLDDSIRSGYVVLGGSAPLTTAHKKIVAEKVTAIQSQAPIYVAVVDKSNLSSALVSYKTLVSTCLAIAIASIM